uniref:Cellulase domain-containing protein n=1 Tax=Globodera pallida TaxID=36090 RepID=A0A183BY34_GLOPA
MRKVSTNCCFLLLAIVALPLAAVQSPPYGQLQVKGSKLMSSSGKQIMLRGMSLFWSQWDPKYWNAETVNQLKCKWGINILRAPMGVEGSDGYLQSAAANAANTQKLMTVVDACINAGIYVIIDWHYTSGTAYTDKAVEFFKKMAQKYGKNPHIFSTPGDIPSQQQLQQRYWQVQSGGGGILAGGQQPFRGGTHPMLSLDNQPPPFHRRTVNRAPPIKRALRDEDSADGGDGEGREGTAEGEKENQQPKAKRLHLPESDGEVGEEEEEEEEQSSRSTKSSSSAENEESVNCFSSSALHQQQSQPHNTANLMVTPHQRSQASSASIGNPLAHSTPYLGALSLNSFQQPLDYWGNSLCNFYGQQHQNLMAAQFGGGTASGASGSFSLQTQGYAPILQQNLSVNSSYQSRDSGVGSVKVELKEDGKNETGSSTSGSDESGSSAIGRDLVGMSEAKFPPFFQAIIVDGQKTLRDLESIQFGMVPPRLALLNCNKKYPITLAEIFRRLNCPELLNTSYLSGILRKAKNTNAGKELRNHLNSYGCGIDLRTGRRKQSSVTTFTTLCEAIQMADDFNKLASESFPHQQIAQEMNRRADAKCSNVLQRLLDVRNSSQILREAIQILEQGIEDETLPFPFANQQPALVEPADQSLLLPTTLNGIKNFSRLSHCFGNRTVMVAWGTLLNVFQKWEQSLDETLKDVVGLPGTSNNDPQQSVKRNYEG